MLKSIVVAAGLIVAVGTAPTLAQTPSPKVQASVWGGYVWSDGVEATNAVLAPDGNVYNSVSPKDGGVFGFNVGFLVGPSAEVGFIYGRQFSNLVIGGTADRELGDLAVSTYHGYFAYNFMDPGGKLRPFALIGFGATNYSSVDATLLGVPRTIPGETQFSTTWSAGVNYFPAPKFGVRGALRWTPTYIKTDSTGWWCDPYWGCYLTGDPQYSNQLELSVGFTVRF